MAQVLYVAALRDLPAFFTGPVVLRVYKGGATKASWQSAPIVFNQYCAWDWRNPEHVLELPDKSSLCIEVWSHPTTRGQKEELAGSVFLDDDSPVEGWKRLEMTSGAAAMGFAFVRVGPRLTNPSAEGDKVGAAAIYLEEELPDFPEESAIRMEPEPDRSLSQPRVLSLAVSLCDVAFVRNYLLGGGSIKTPVIISRGVNGFPLEAVCANCPSGLKRKRLRIEFDGGAYTRSRCADDAVAIARLLLIAGAKHDARSVRWLYENAANSQGKIALMRVLDCEVFPPERRKKATKKAPGASAASVASESPPTWNATKSSGEVSRQNAVKLGGGRRRPSQKTDETYLKAQEALSRQAKVEHRDDESLSSSEDVRDPEPSAPAPAAAKEPAKKTPRGHGFAPRPEGESSDLEEESSSTDDEERKRRAAADAKKALAHRYMPRRLSEPSLVQAPPTNTAARAAAAQRAAVIPGSTAAIPGPSKTASAAAAAPVVAASTVAVAPAPPVVAAREEQEPEEDAENEDEVMMDWGGVETDASFIEVGEEVAAEPEQPPQRVPEGLHSQLDDVDGGEELLIEVDASARNSSVFETLLGQDAARRSSVGPLNPFVPPSPAQDPFRLSQDASVDVLPIVAPVRPSKLVHKVAAPSQPLEDELVEEILAEVGEEHQ